MALLYQSSTLFWSCAASLAAVFSNESRTDFTFLGSVDVLVRSLAIGDKRKREISRRYVGRKLGLRCRGIVAAIKSIYQAVVVELADEALRGVVTQQLRYSLFEILRAFLQHCLDEFVSR
jgi:hypothetical protein